MSDKRETRNNIGKEVDLLKPLDILSFGSDDDPCFGKLHDLKAPECKMCGDADFCAIVMSQNLHKERLKFETTQKMKDLDEAEDIMVEKKRNAKKDIAKYQEQGLKRTKIIIKVSKKYNLTKDLTKELYNQI